MISAIETLGPFIGRGNSVAPLIQVHDLSRALYAAGMEGAAAGQVFNLTSGAGDTWSDFLQAIAGALGRSFE